MKKLAAGMLCAALAAATVTVPVMADSQEMVLYTWEAMFPQEVLDSFEEETDRKSVV